MIVVSPVFQLFWNSSIKTPFTTLLVSICQQAPFALWSEICALFNCWWNVTWGCWILMGIKVLEEQHITEIVPTCTMKGWWGEAELQFCWFWNHLIFRQTSYIFKGDSSNILLWNCVYLPYKHKIRALLFTW